MNPYIIPGIQERQPPPDSLIVEILEDLTGVTIDKAKSKCRKPECVLFRWAYWATVRRFNPTISLEMLGVRFHRDHSTVIYGLSKCDNMFEFDLQKLLISVVKKLSKLGYKLK